MWNLPDRHDYFIAALRADVKNVLVTKKENLTNPIDCIVKFKTDRTEPTKPKPQEFNPYPVDSKKKVGVEVGKWVNWIGGVVRKPEDVS